MSLPSFHATTLFTHAPVSLPGSIEPRLFFETLPGVDGEFVQTHGHAGKTWQLRGILRATGNTAALALLAFRAALVARQALADGATVGTFTDNEGSSHTNCIVLRYDPLGPCVTGPHASAFLCESLCSCTIRELNP